MINRKLILAVSLSLLCGGFIYAQPKAAGEPRAIAQMNEPLRTPVWSPDGTKLTLTSLKNNGIWVVANDGSGLQRITDEPGAGYRMKWSEETENALMRKMLDDPAEMTNYTPELQALKGYFVFNPVLSPQGDKIVFQTNNGKGLYICNADGSQLRNLGPGERASWTPDGKYVVVMITEDDGETITKGELVCLNVTDGKRTVLLSSDKYVALSPAVSPDGKKLAFEEYATGAVYVMDIE
jgi:Tol biopolymer transport system component